MAVAVNCCEDPAVMLGSAGVTLTPVMVGAAVTVSAALPVMPLIVAVMFAVPVATPVARPDPLTVAAAEFDEAHVAEEVTLAVDPSL